MVNTAKYSGWHASPFGAFVTLCTPGGDAAASGLWNVVLPDGFGSDRREVAVLLAAAPRLADMLAILTTAAINANPSRRFRAGEKADAVRMLNKATGQALAVLRLIEEQSK